MRGEPLHKRWALLWQIRLLSRVGQWVCKIGWAFRHRAATLTDQAVADYRKTRNEAEEKDTIGHLTEV